MARAQGALVEPVAGEPLRGPVRDQQVRATEQSIEDGTVRGDRGIERYALLVAVHDLPRERRTPGVAQVSQGVAARRLHLHDARAEIAEEGRDLRGGGERREIDDEEVFEAHGGLARGSYAGSQSRSTPGAPGRGEGTAPPRAADAATSRQLAISTPARSAARRTCGDTSAASSSR